MAPRRKRPVAKRGGPGGLADARAAIARIDADLLRLLNRRAAVVAALHKRKARLGKPIYDAQRTDAILDRLLRLNKGPLRDDQVLGLFTFLLHHYALGHRPGTVPPDPPLLVAEAAPGTSAILRRHGIRRLRPGDRRRKLVDARGRRNRTAAILEALAAGAQGAILAVSSEEDEEALADLCYRAKLLCLALRAGGGR